MAGLGRPPKDPKLRARRNKASTAAEAPVEKVAEPLTGAPQLPARETPWHALTVAWWKDVWASEFADEYTKLDAHGLTRLAIVVDRFYQTGELEDLKEIRLQEARFGLDLMARRRLQWTVKKVEETAATTEEQPVVVEDPRAILRAVK